MDIVCWDDLDLYGAELDDPQAELAQDLYHRLIEPRGSNLDDPDRGIGLDDALSGTYDPDLPRRIETEFRKDDRVAAVVATVTEISEGVFRVEIEIEADGELVPIVVESDGNGGFRRIR
jgi:hypothetical protein